MAGQEQSTAGQEQTTPQAQQEKPEGGRSKKLLSSLKARKAGRMRTGAARKPVRKPKAAIEKKAPKETKPEETKPEETKPEETKPEETKPADAEAKSTKVAPTASNDIVRLANQFQFEGISQLPMKTQTETAKPSRLKGINNRGFYPPTPSKHVNYHMRSHHLISQPRKITHSKLGVM